MIELQMAADDVHVAYAEEEKQYRKAGMLLELWHQDSINNVDNTVSALNVGLFYDGSIDFYPMTQPTVLFNLERSTLHRGHTLLFAQVRGHELLRDDVIGQDIL